MILRNGMDWERVAPPPGLDSHPLRQSTLGTDGIVMRLAAIHGGRYRVN